MSKQIQSYKLKFCIPITGKNLTEIQTQVKEAEKEADLTELRLDYLEDLSSKNIEEILKKVFTIKTKDMIITLRSKRQGGFYPNKYEEQIEILLMACELGFEYIDIELEWPSKIYKTINKNKRNTLVIASYHNFKKTLTEYGLRKIARRLAWTHADILKIATFANTATDNLRVFDIIDFVKRRYKLPTIAICMGEKGKTSRVLTCSMGGFLTFACLDENKKTAEGQMTVEEIKEIQKQLAL